LFCFDGSENAVCLFIITFDISRLLLVLQGGLERLLLSFRFFSIAPRFGFHPLLGCAVLCRSRLLEASANKPVFCCAARPDGLVQFL